MEVLVKQHQIAPVWITGVSLIISVAWPSSILIGQKQRHYAPAQFKSNITQAYVISRPGGALYRKAVTVKTVVEFLAPYEEVVH